MATGTQSQVVNDFVDIAVDRESLRRQRVQAILREEPHGHVAFDTLVNRVYEREYTGETDPVSHRRRVANALHYVHLPRLTELGVIEYDSNRRCATLATDS